MLLCPRARSLVRYQIESGIREDHVTHGLMVLDIAGAAADVPVEGLLDGFLQLSACHRLLCQTLQQDLALIQKAGGAIPHWNAKCSTKAFCRTESSPFL